MTSHVAPAGGSPGAKHVAVVGAGIAGLGCALLLGRAGHRVTLLERDDTPLPEDPRSAFETWERRGAPQARHSHAFLARLRNLLRDRLPDVLEALLEAGAEELPIANLLREGIDDPSPRPGDDDLTLLACRRLTFEWVLHRISTDEPRVELIDGAEVGGLLADDASAPVRVRGLSYVQGGQQRILEADLVVDASGRRSPLGRWLGEIGAPVPEVESEPCGIFYCSRFYALRPGVEPPERDTTIGADLGYLKYAIFHGDSKIFSVTFAAAPKDRPLRALLRSAPFTAAAEALPATRAWVDPAVAEPISEVHPMDGLRNTRRLFVQDGRLLALGVVAIGDAAIHSNPLYGRGCAFALVHAALLADRLAEHPYDDEALALALEADVEREIVPWYDLARGQDRDAAAWAEKLRSGADEEAPSPGGVVDPKAYLRDLMRRGFVPALRLDATVLRAFLRGFNLLDPPGDLMQNPEVLRRVLDVYQGRDQREEPELGPGRAAMIQLLEDAA